MAAGKPGPVLPDRYTKALAGADPIASQKRAPKRLARLVEGLSEKELAVRPAPGKWSIREILAHLADGEVVLGARCRMVAAMDRPPIAGYDQDAFVDRLVVDRRKAKELLGAFAAVRAANVALLEKLPAEAFDRVGIHSERGKESLAKMVAMYAGHDLVHEEQIETIRLALFPAGKKRHKGAKKQEKGATKREAVEEEKKKGKKGGR
jgi:hypothetical protein